MSDNVNNQFWLEDLLQGLRAVPLPVLPPRDGPILPVRTRAERPPPEYFYNALPVGLQMPRLVRQVAVNPIVHRPFVEDFGGPIMPVRTRGVQYDEPDDEPVEEDFGNPILPVRTSANN